MTIPPWLFAGVFYILAVLVIVGLVAWVSAAQDRKTVDGWEC